MVVSRPSGCPRPARVRQKSESKGIAEYEVPKSAIAEKIAEVIIANMTEEEKLNKDVEKLLSAHEDEIAKENMDYRKVFELTKNKLAKERGFVL